jgi:death on curing protein
VLEVPAERLVDFKGLVPLAESALRAPQANYFGVEFYPSFEMKAAVLCSRLIRNHPLPDGNKRAAYLSLREFVARNGRRWTSADPDEVADVFEALAARRMSEDELARWVEERLA